MNIETIHCSRGRWTKREAKRRQGGGGESSHRRVPLPQLFPEWDYTQKHKWGMSIDINSCIGCNACVVACQAENNIPVVGKDQCERGREMHWIRIDTYFGGPSLDNPETYFEPIPCMHCENAPCELVCPVAATVHDDEGINNMVYNRCVGTRYCSNNCPYKVRRFNFLEYNGSPLNSSESQKLQRNPEVTVRSRGVMEKCTYCIQRVNNTRIEFEKEQVRIEEQGRKSGEPAEQIKGDVMAAFRNMYHSLETACQQSCPTRAIVFGDMNDPSEPGRRREGITLGFRAVDGTDDPAAHDVPGPHCGILDPRDGLEVAWVFDEFDARQFDR